ncbi:hypothetical protein NBRC116584_34880 [Hydrogenophaga sp. 5NK40-0174]
MHTELAEVAMQSVQIPDEDWCEVPAPWVSEKSDITNYMVRIPPSRRWRRVYHYVAPHGQSCNGMTNYFYVKHSSGKETQVLFSHGYPRKG